MSALHDFGLWFLAALLELLSSGEYRSLTLPHLLWAVAVVILSVSVWKMGLSGTVPYFVKHWYRLLMAAVAGIAIPLMLVAPWKPTTLQLPSALFSAPAVTSLALILVLGIMATSGKLTEYWRRYLRTLCIPDPPAQPTFVISTAVVLGGLIVNFSTSPFSLSFPQAKWSILALELGFWVVAPLLTAALVPESTVLPVAAGQKRQESPGDYWDDPIATEGEDLLGRRDFARRLADEIVTLPGKHSFVFGLIARWGEGKTSVLNLVKRRLESCPNAIIVDFNPWYFASEIGILEAFYGSIERAIEERFLLPSFKRRIRRYLKTLSIGLDHKPFSLDLELPENPERLRQELEGFIARTGARLVIFLDDIDRLDRDLALGALALTRLSARFQNTVFLLAFDADELKKKGIDHNFLEKIIQKQIVLPPAEHRDVDEFFLYSDDNRASAVDSLLDKLGVTNDRKSDFHEELDPLYAQHLRSVFATLRDVKRFLNVLRSLLAPVIGEVNLIDFFLLTVLQIFASRIYKDIWENREFYMPTEFVSGSYRVSVSETDSELRKSQVRSHVEGMLDEDAEREEIKEVLASLFPEVANAFGSMIGQSRQQPQGREQRLSDTLCFPRYFLGRIPAGQISDGEVRSIIQRWNGVGDGAISLVADDLERYALRKQIQELVQRVAVFAGDIDSRQAERAVLGLAEFTVRTKWDGEQDPPSPSALFSLAIATANRSPMGLFVVASELAQSGSIYFASGLVSWLSGRIECTAENTASLKALMEKAEARLHRDFVEGDRDIFIECPSSFQHILYWWATAWLTRPRSDEVENYVVKTVEKCPSDLGRLLTAFTQQRDVFPDWFLTISAVIGPQKLAELISRFGNVLQSEAERSAAGVITQAVAKASGAPPKS